MKVTRNSTVLMVFLFIISLICATAQAQKIAFVTSVKGPGNLSSWPDAMLVGATGVEAGDAICQARALAVGLDNPLDFVAWLSDSNDDAYCRIHGLTGTKAANCGQVVFPAAAGPWVRMDGFPFADEITEMLAPNGKVFTPILLDEFGQQGAQFYHWTGTSEAGELTTSFPSACTDWSSSASSDSAYAGRATRTSRGWTRSDGNACNAFLRLLCLEGGGAGEALPQFTTDDRVAFLTSVNGYGNLSSWPDAGGATGIAAADTICRARAAAAGLDDPNSFKAWLSDSMTAAKDRFLNDGRWVRLDGVKIADSLAELTDGQLFTSINVTETGVYTDGFTRVWTASGQDGMLIGGACNNWTDGSDSAQGRQGYSIDTAHGWTDWIDRDCDTAQRLYCFSDVVSNWIFGDDFEEGDMGSWSAWVPGP